MGKPWVRPALTTALRRSCRARDFGPGSSVTTFRSVPTEESIEETMTCSWVASARAALQSYRHFFTNFSEQKRVTEVTRCPPAEEVGFEPTVPGDTAVFE